ncbi:MAG: class I SAM-dependent methyltransferase [Phycisphaerales bacterium]|nr:class I SAM-dependent methyltransferase [Phycisphaeraceae bacterium]
MPMPAHFYAQQRDWPGYFAAVAGKGPRETLVMALKHHAEHFGKPPSGESSEDPGREPPLAIDLAAGEGRDTAEILRRGWRVLAIDAHPDAIARLSSRSDLVPRSRLTIRQESMEEAHLPSCSLLNASFALPFCSPDNFSDLWARIAHALRPDGLFAGQFFGDRDSWASLPDRTHHTTSQVRALLRIAGLSPIHLAEEERDATDCADALKHWHVFHVVARKAATHTPHRTAP